MAQITKDNNNVVTSWCTVGGIEGGISVDSIPQEVQTAPIGQYKYIDDVFVINADYTEPKKEPVLTQEEINLDIDFRLTSLELGL